MLDIVTTLLLWSTAAFTIAVLLFLCWLNERAMTAYLFWATGFAATSAGTLFVALRGQVPAFLSINIGNAFILAGLGLWIAGLLRFDGKRAPAWAGAPPVLWLIGLLVPDIAQSFTARVSLFNIAALIGYLMLFHILWPKWRVVSSSRRILAAVFLFNAALSGTVAIAVHNFEGVGFRNYSFLALSTGIGLLSLIVIAAGRARLIMERQEEKWRLLAFRDPLTGALNRRGLLSQFDSVKRIAENRGGMIALLLFDLDHFKQINDRYGHYGGDIALMEFAAMATSVIGSGDCFGRLGGEEFAAFLSVRRTSEARAVAEQIRSMLADTPVTTDTGDILATVSVGVAVLPPSTASFALLMRSADRALYAAKANGRNRTETDGMEGAKDEEEPVRPAMVQMHRLQA